MAMNLESWHNVAIYIDYENVYKTLLHERRNLIRLGFFERLQEWCRKKKLRVVKIVAYCNYDNEDLHISHHQTLLQEYGVSTIHTSNRGKNYADIQISIDAINDMYLNGNIDEFIIMSNDKDMSPLLNSIKLNKRKVTLLTVGKNYDRAIRNVPDEHVQLDDIISQTSRPDLYISQIKEKVYRSLVDFLHEHICVKNDFKKYEYTYTLQNHVQHFCVMEYEMLHIFKDLYEEGRLVVYQYVYGEKVYYGIISDTARQALVDAGIVSDLDFVDNFNFDEKIKDSYQKFL